MNPGLILAVATSLIMSVHPTHDHAERIQAVEQGLTPLNRIQGEPSWTIEERMEHHGIPGVCLAVIQDSKIAWIKGYGVMDRASGEPVTPSTLFQAGSISKALTAYAALRLVEEGTLDLDEPVNDRLSSWKIPDNEFTRDTPVSLRHLLSHSAGLPGSYGFYEFDTVVPSLVQVLDGTPPALTPPIRVEMKPGTRYRYANCGYAIIQQLMIDVEGATFPEIMDRTVLKPIGMADSTFEQRLPADQMKRAATGIHNAGQRPVRGKANIYPNMAAGGLWTTAEDLAHFAIDLQRAIGDGSGKVISKSMMETMATPVIDAEYGLGMNAIGADDDVYLNHNGATTGFNAHLFAHSTKGYGVVIMMNTNRPAFMGELERSIAQVYDWEGFLSPAFTKHELTDTEVDRVAGRYLYSTDTLIKVFGEDGRLFMQYQGSPKTELVRIADNEYIRRDRANTISFVEDDTSGDLMFQFTMRNGGKVNHSMYHRLDAGEKLPSEWVYDGNYEEARHAYRTMLSRHPGTSEAIQKRLIDWGVDLVAANGKDEMGFELLTMSTELFPESANALVNLAWAYQHIGENDSAIDFYEAALVINPDSTYSKLELAKLISQADND